MRVGGGEFSVIVFLTYLIHNTFFNIFPTPPPQKKKKIIINFLKFVRP